MIHQPTRDHPPLLFRPEGEATTLDLANEAVANSLAPGTTLTEDFVWEWPTENNRFGLYFPETEAIYGVP
jgi:hypothetical protein